jgi:prevent-host-death family protein
VKSAKIAELKNNLSRYLDYVKAGGAVMVLDRDRPVAQIVPLSRPGARFRVLEP